MSNDDCEGLEDEVTEKMLRLPLLVSEDGIDLRTVLRGAKYLKEQKIATITATRKMIPSVQKAIASLDCETHSTSGPRYVEWADASPVRNQRSLSC